MKQKEGSRYNDCSFIDANVDQLAGAGTRTSHRFTAIPTSFARVRRLMREGASYSLSGIVFAASTKVINNRRASWNTQRSAIRVSWFRDSASGL
jgi:hypothetical protein